MLPPGMPDGSDDGVPHMAQRLEAEAAQLAHHLEIAQDRMAVLAFAYGQWQAMLGMMRGAARCSTTAC
jgi:hypothetical protein